MLSILLLGFLVGLQHAMEADHVAAVATLVSRDKGFGETARQGVVWGIGHGLTLFVFAGMVLLLDAVIPTDLARLLEQIVGIMLIILGIDVLRRLSKERIHFHLHKHGKFSHIHAHSHHGRGEHALDPHEHQHRDHFPFRALFVGMMHGMAGSAALILLTLESVASPVEGLLYILLFGVGSIVGMGLLAVVIAVPFRYSEKTLTWAHSSLQGIVGLLTLGLGVSLVYVNFAVV